MKITFVCTGNTCRSCMAEGLARKWMETGAPGRADIEFASAGIAAHQGSPASRQAVEVMGLAGIDLTSHRASQFSPETLEHSDLILTMTAGHKQVITDEFPASAGKIFTLAEYAGGLNRDIPDPFGQSAEVYAKCREVIGELVGMLLHRILQS